MDSLSVNQLFIVISDPRYNSAEDNIEPITHVIQSACALNEDPMRAIGE